MKKKTNQTRLMNLYRNLVLSRRYEEKLIELFRDGKISGWIHSGLGQEATGVAVGECLRETDYLVPYFRSRSSLFAKGMDPKRLSAEIFGKITGCCKGRSGESHVAEAALGILGAGGLIGSPIPIGVGLAYTAFLKGEGQVVACHFGDGATSRGAFHESMNMAAVMNLPIVFVCENNQYTEWTPTSAQMNIEDISTRAEGYGMPGVSVDGNDPIAVLEAVEPAVDRARKGKGPSLIETKTYRIRGHFEGDPCRYRTEEEVKKWEKLDPLPRFQERLKEHKLLDDKKISQVEEQVREIIDEAFRFAMESPLPTREEIMHFVYA